MSRIIAFIAYLNNYVAPPAGIGAIAAVLVGGCFCRLTGVEGRRHLVVEQNTNGHTALKRIARQPAKKHTPLF